MPRTSYTVYRTQGKYPNLIYVAGVTTHSRKEAKRKALKESGIRIHPSNLIVFSLAEKRRFGLAPRNRFG